MANIRNVSDLAKARSPATNTLTEVIENHNSPTKGSNHQGDEQTPLMEAVELGDHDAVAELLKTAVDLEAEAFGETALTLASDRDMVLMLLRAGADITRISSEGRRALVGLKPESDPSLLAHISPAQFREGRKRRFGTRNPESQDILFWNAMIQAGITSYSAAQFFKDLVERGGEPVWCAERYGQSFTQLPDGRTIQIGGEHEDYYDQDFCIYNDVFVHQVDGAVQVYGYPEDVFPPTDFHTATLLGSYIYIIGSLGYGGSRRYGKTPVYRLDTQSFHIKETETTGEAPGWISHHKATTLSDHEISISGGMVVREGGLQERSVEQTGQFVLDTQRLCWTRMS
ncbi:hypothetical protein AOQ84DRAFT_5124 [Glonium stellatum]|uniref:Uncharacterized protein n=1 Tax=Glonium stellatum TaxID=574774 RepID=A0A8E2JUM0_9PEZI|nr:hypothetical protein AOQ84DRAFT_5124 [Glonium stellatum]